MLKGVSMFLLKIFCIVLFLTSNLFALAPYKSANIIQKLFKSDEILQQSMEFAKLYEVYGDRVYQWDSDFIKEMLKQGSHEKNRSGLEALQQLLVRGEEFVSSKQKFSEWISQYIKLFVENKIYFYPMTFKSRLAGEKYEVCLNSNRAEYEKIFKSGSGAGQVEEWKKKFVSKFDEIHIHRALCAIKLKSGKSIYVLPNNCPYAQGHVMIISDIYNVKESPQILKKEDLDKVLEFMDIKEDDSLRICFNSMQFDEKGNFIKTGGGGASINHLHLHLFTREKFLPIENFELEKLKQKQEVLLYKLKEYPLDVYVFESKNYEKLSGKVMRFVEKLQEKDIAHNLLIKKENGKYKLYVVLRKQSKPFGSMEAAGIKIVNSQEEYGIDISEQEFLDFMKNVKLDKEVLDKLVVELNEIFKTEELLQEAA
jgi:diadenosine tetraphosphate (Ap4A) HIT family hydrolase